MGIRRVFCTMASLLLLVLVLGITGAFADGVTAAHSRGDFVTFDAVHNFTRVAALHSDFDFNANTGFAGIRNGYKLWTSLLDGPTAEIVPVPPDPPSTTPEPGTLYLLLMGGGLLALGMRRRTTQS